jgi:hypothetical protein
MNAELTQNKEKKTKGDIAIYNAKITTTNKK